MQKICTCFLLIFSLGTLKAQQLILEHKLPGGNHGEINAGLSFNENKILARIIYETGVDRIVFENGSIINTVVQQKIPSGSTGSQQNYIYKKDWENTTLIYLGSILQNDTILECTYAAPQKGLYFTATSLAAGTTNTCDTIYLSKEEDLLLVTSYQRSIYVICSVKDSDKLTVYIKRNGQKFKGFEKDLSFTNPADINNKKTTRFADYFSNDTEYYVFDNKLSYPSLLSSARNKIYVQGDKIIFSLENRLFETYLATVRLDDLTHSIRKYPSLPRIQTVSDIDPSDFINSFLQDSFLCKTGVFHDVFFLQVFNTASEKIVYSTFLQTTGKDEFEEAPFFRNGRFINLDGKIPKRLIWLLKNRYFYLHFRHAGNGLCDVTLQLYEKKLTASAIALLVVNGLLNVAAPLAILNNVPSNIYTASLLNIPFNFEARLKDVAGGAIQSSIDGNTGQLIKNNTNKEQHLHSRIGEVNSFFRSRDNDLKKHSVYIVNNVIYACCMSVSETVFYVYRF